MSLYLNCHLKYMFLFYNSRSNPFTSEIDHLHLLGAILILNLYLSYIVVNNYTDAETISEKYHKLFSKY